MDVRSLCLAVISRGPASGYDIKKMLSEPPISHFQETSYGSIYPALGRLTKEGLTNCVEERQAKRPDKKTYSLTAKGRRALREALSAPLSPDRFRSDFLFALFFGDQLPAETLLAMIATRQAAYQERVDGMQDCDLSEASPQRRFVHGFGLALYAAAAGYLERETPGLEAALTAGDALGQAAE